MSQPDVQFDFGANWMEYSQRALTPERLEASARAFEDLMRGVPLAGRSFLDIGFGQGLIPLNAARAGAKVVAVDINPKSVEALRETARRFPDLDLSAIDVHVGSILDAADVATLRRASPSGDGLYDVVHSWGVLHHTGNMGEAIRNAAALVRPGGHFVIAIYNRHWTSPVWRGIKWTYVRSPSWAQKLLVRTLLPVIAVAKRAVTRDDPRKQQRGMDFYYDVVDWVGGYPYEYHSADETRALLARHGLTCERTIPAEVPTGCNQFVFRLSDRPAA
jgi:2-polyprenyl-3-methyl-5-hydroxy-6-metoxy-1,4-benzoquinol methylase